MYFLYTDVPVFITISLDNISKHLIVKIFVNLLSHNKLLRSKNLQYLSYSTKTCVEDYYLIAR